MSFNDAKLEAIRWHDVKYIQEYQGGYVLKSYQADFASECGGQKVFVKPQICARKSRQIYYRGCYENHPDLATIEDSRNHLEKIKKIYFTQNGILGIGGV